MKRILISLLTVGAVAGTTWAATGAFFSDTETSENNTFVAGAIDLKVDYTGYYNEEVGGDPWVQWDLEDLTESRRFFDFEDLKPGDFGEGTISLHVYNNPAWACVTIDPTMNDDNGSTEPELELDEPDGDSIFDGELAQSLQFEIWADTNCNNTLDAGEQVLTSGSGPVTPRMWPIADSQTSEPLDPQEDYCIGVNWNLPEEVGNEAQTDKYMADISFYVAQARNNEQFTCPVYEGFPEDETHTLRLENEIENPDGPWTVKSGDEIYADLTWDGDGAEFVYDLDAHNLASDTDYSLIYYADGWPGNHPGALLGEFVTDSNGDFIATNEAINLNHDLPHPDDENAAIGAKIWLIPSEAYNDTTFSVNTWPPDQDTWLFEGNVYINYQDTDVTP